MGHSYSRFSFPRKYDFLTVFIYVHCSKTGTQLHFSLTIEQIQVQYQTTFLWYNFHRKYFHFTTCCLFHFFMEGNWDVRSLWIFRCQLNWNHWDQNLTGKIKIQRIKGKLFAKKYIYKQLKDYDNLFIFSSTISS